MGVMGTSGFGFPLMACGSYYGLNYAGSFVFVLDLHEHICLRGVLEEAFKNTFLLELNAACALMSP